MFPKSALTSLVIIQFMSLYVSQIDLVMQETIRKHIYLAFRQPTIFMCKHIRFYSCTKGTKVISLYNQVSNGDICMKETTPRRVIDRLDNIKASNSI